MQDSKDRLVRIRWLVIGTTLIGVLVIGRLFSLQVVNASRYKDKAEHQYLSPTSGSFDRGNIYFTKRDGTTIAAATVESGFKLAVNPETLEDPELVYEKLSEVIPLQKEDFLAKAHKKNDPYEEIAQHLSQEDADKITALDLAGVSLYRDKWRFYPGGSLAAKVIGFVSYKGDDLVGRYGLEQYYNDVLTRTDANFYVNFFAEIFANIQSTLFTNTGATGDVVTSLEPTVQTQLEKTVQDIEDKWNGDSVGGVIMDPNNGEIVALAGSPGFDLNSFGSVENVATYSNPVVQSDFEMGSIIKPLVMAAAIETGAVTPTTTYFDKGSVVVNDRTISNFDKKGRGTATMQDVLNQSLNTGMVFVQQKMGKPALKEYLLDHYHLGEKTGIDLPGEVNGLTGNLKTPNDVNYATAAFGQGIAVTPINVVRAYASLANGGYLVTPHVAVAIDEENGTTKKLEYKKSDTPILKPETLDTIRNMLITVVDKGYKRGLPHYTIAAKTGTAQVAKPDGTGYYDDRHLHSLIGYFPATNPRFVLYLYNMNPRGVEFAAQSLADSFYQMVQFLTSYYEITPDR